MPEDDFWRWASQLARGVVSLHDIGIIHLAIEPDNIHLANDTGDVVVGVIYSGSLPVLGSDHLAIGGNEAAAVAFDSRGDAQWVTTFVGPGDDAMQSVYLDEAGETFVALGFQETVDFAGQTATAEETDVLLARLSSDGSLSGKAAPLRSAEQKAAASLSEGDRSPVLVHGAGGQVSRG